MEIKKKKRITFEIKTEYCLKILMPKTMKVLGSTKRITKYKNGENVHHFKITEKVLVHCNIVNNDYQRDSVVLYTFVPNNSFDWLLDISSQNF